MKVIPKQNTNKNNDTHRKNSVHLAIPRKIRNEIKIPDYINSSRGPKDTTHSQTLQNSCISYDKSFISIRKFFKNKEEFNNYMLYSYSKSQYNKIIENLAEIENKIKDNNISMEKMNNFLIKLKEKKKQKQSDIVNLLSNKESLEEIYKTKIHHLKRLSQLNKNKILNINGPVKEDEINKIINIKDIYDRGDNPSNLTTINANEAEIIDISIDEIKNSDRKKYEEQVILFTEGILQKKDEILNDTLREKIQLAYQIFSSEENKVSIMGPNEVISNFFLRISLFISNQSLGNYSEQIINIFLRDLMKINSIGVKILKNLKFLNKKYKDIKTEVKEKISELNKKIENLKNKKKSYETKKEELENFLSDYKDRDAKSTDKNRIYTENENSQYCSFLSDNINNNNNNNNNSKTKINEQNIQDKVINIKKETKIDKNKSFKTQIPYLKVSHKIKNKVISINNVIDNNNNNKQNLNKRDNSTDIESNNYKNDEKNFIIKRIKNYKEGLKSRKKYETEHNIKEVGGLSQRSENYKKDNNSLYTINIKRETSANIKDSDNQHNKTEIGENKNSKLELQIIKTKNINVNRILNINNYQINNNWNNNYKRIENKKSNNNISNTDGNINMSHNQIIHNVKKYINNYIPNKEENKKFIRQKTDNEINRNNKINVNNLLINNNINIDNNNSKIINSDYNNKSKNIIELNKKKNYNIFNNINKSLLTDTQKLKLTYKKINIPKNELYLNNVINNNNKDINENMNRNINSYNKKDYSIKGINNSVIEIKDNKRKDNDIKNQEIFRKKKIIYENDKKDKNLSNSNNSHDKGQNHKNNIPFINSKSNSTKNLKNGMSINSINSPSNIYQKQNKIKIFSPKNNIKTEILFSFKNIKNNSFSSFVRNAKSPRIENNKIINKLMNTGNNNAIYISKKVPKKPEYSSECFINNKKNIYSNRTHETNMIDIIKKRDIPVIRSNYNNNYSKRYDNRLQVLTQGIAESFCYFKITDIYINNFNPLENGSLNPIKIGYNDGYISIDIDTHMLKIMTKNTKERNPNKNIILIELKDIVDVIVSNEMKIISKIHTAYIKYKKDKRDKQNNILDTFINTSEIINIPMNRSDKIKAAICTFFVFSVIFAEKTIPKIDFIFNNFEQFNLWQNCFQYIIKNNSQS